MGALISAMLDQWVEAGTALVIGGSRAAIWARCHAGLIRSRAELYRHNGTDQYHVEVPREFWRGDGSELPTQNWIAGDFNAGTENGEHWCAFGVRFDLEGLLALVPSEDRAAVRLRHSVAGNPAWVSARDAINLGAQEPECSVTTAGGTVVEQCRLGFLIARAVEMRFVNDESDGLNFEDRECDIPPWCWESFSSDDVIIEQLILGRFAGDVRAPYGFGAITLSGVHFLRTSLDMLSVSAAGAQPVLGEQEPAKPNLPEATLIKWWNKIVNVRDVLTQQQLLALARGSFPDNTVARDRIRGISKGRARGPKPITR